ncbi:ribonuclease P protein subunit p21-like [Dendronephthya gigantea]|uniref:ribonuclease P protein subunit p21-like n=1 Tax=Dendronephthya gigantea TaxID=151771 RepID=UPI00106A1CF5|nr:ribonuclease P protein subunit p21-like [Dendronephthya gigantea]XP_028417300.1 ribonuclease P protein subunit p21-like [Dendronephthya gigantea]XP_028418633.1 ribonuclease P protein subunit p21-like [Dendronephthya gigantea]
MGNKRKMKERREEKSLANKEAYTRMNFLYQASQTVLMENPQNVELSRFYIFTMKNIGQKLLCKIDPSIKRTVCKYCHSVLIPGVTSTVRVRGKREKHVVVTCLDCGTLKRFNTRKNYQLWCEQQENENTQEAK